MTTTPDIDVAGQPVFSVQLQALSEGRDGNGVAGASDLKVTDGTGDNESDIASGTAYYDGSSGSIGSTKTKTHSDGDSSNDRWDLIAFDVSGGSVVLREGTAAADPTPPALQSDEILLAVVYIESEQTDFGSSDIVNFRVLGGTGVTGSDDGSEKVGRVTDVNAADGIEGTDGGGGVLKLDIEPADFAGNGVEDDGSDNIAIATDAIQTDELDLSISPAWTGTHDYTGGGIQLPSGTSKSPTTEAQIAWDSDDDKIKVGDGSTTVTAVNESRTLTGGHAIQSLGDLSSDRTVAVDATDLSGSFLGDSGSGTALDVNLGNGVEGDGSDNIRVNGGAVAGNVLSEDGTNSYQVNLNIGNGLEDNSGTLRVNPAGVAGDGLKETSATAMGVEPADFAGAGLADDGSDNLTPDTSDTGTVTATGGSQPAVNTTVSTSLSQTAAYDVILYADSDPSFNADYQFNWDYAHFWDDSTSTLKLDLTVNWDTDPGSSNDVTLRWEVIKR